ncbi:hypothetical protein F4804DRAFT_293524 [Jackrogersella minutella]|nr:hypothetical protein F4804DRAFT_293524 [Jackrogersella minutella]
MSLSQHSCRKAMCDGEFLPTLPWAIFSAFCRRRLALRLGLGVEAEVRPGSAVSAVVPSWDCCWQLSVHVFVRPHPVIFGVVGGIACSSLGLGHYHVLVPAVGRTLVCWGSEFFGLLRVNSVILLLVLLILALAPGAGSPACGGSQVPFETDELSCHCGK